MTKTKTEAAAPEFYRVTIKPGEFIRVGGLALRPDRPHRVSARVYEANKDKIETHEAL